MNLKKNIKLLAMIQIFLAFIMLVPMSVGFYYHEQDAMYFLYTSVAMVVLGLAFLLITRKETLNLSQRDGYFFVSFTWILATAFGAIPLALSDNCVGHKYSSAFFEIMSGFTTTGASILTDIEGCSRCILFWRSMANWLGGMGIVVLFVAVLPALGAKTGAGTFHLMGAESVGPVKGKLTPKTKTTAMYLWIIYFGLTLAEVISLALGGLSLYDAVCVAFSTISAAGFSVKSASIGGYNSAYVDVVVTIFMVFAGINFSLYYKAFTNKRKQILKDTELRWFLGIFFLFSCLAAVILFANQTYSTFGKALRYSSFHIASILTTTGFATADYLLWPASATMFVILVMFVGGCAGSAGGGMKVIRVASIFKSGSNTIKKKIHPTAVSKVKFGEDIIDNDTMTSILSFICVYLMTWLIGSLIVSFSGSDIETCLSSSLLTLGNIGIGFGKVGPTGNFAMFPSWCSWVFSFLMLVGRLELFTVYALFSKSFWK